MPTSTSEANKRIVRRIYQRGFNAGDPAVFDELYAPDFVHHNKTIHDVASGAAGEKQSMLRFREAIPDAAVPGETAANLSGTPGLQSLSAALAAHPDVVLVHRSIGGNDFLGAWNASLSPAQEDALFDAIVADVDTIVQHVLTLRPDVRLLQPSYDYPRPLPNGTPLEVNSAAEELEARLQTLAGSTAGMTFENLNGLMQIHFGIPGLGIPPFDPSLPRIDQPSPAAAFANAIHLTSQGPAALLLAALLPGWVAWRLRR